MVDRVYPKPVRHGHALKAPFTSENALEDVRVLREMSAIETVVTVLDVKYLRKEYFETRTQSCKTKALRTFPPT